MKKYLKYYLFILVLLLSLRMQRMKPDKRKKVVSCTLSREILEEAKKIAADTLPKISFSQYVESALKDYNARETLKQ